MPHRPPHSCGLYPGLILFSLLLSPIIPNASAQPTQPTQPTEKEPTPEIDPPSYDAFDKEPHHYFQRTPQDPVSHIQKQLESGQWQLDRSHELAFLKSFLEKLHIPVSSQLLVFSTTSLQLSLISPRNPRALYFNEEVYVGFIPGGRIEVVSIDPDLGGIFYIFDVPKQPDQMVRLDRSHRCMNCHAGEDSGFVPGLVLKSVIPGPSGGSLTAYRTAQYGHHIPLEDRFGGWHVTLAPTNLTHHGNITGSLNAGKLSTFPNPPGSQFSWTRYPTDTSDLVAHLLLEHQSGFINRVAEAAYRARTISFIQQNKSPLTTAQSQELDSQASTLVDYLLFRHEAPLPPQGVQINEAFRKAFHQNQRSVQGTSLKTFNLKSRLFENRCSYMIHTPQFNALPPLIRNRVLYQLQSALHPVTPSAAGQHLAPDERQRIRTILTATVPGLEAAWTP